MKNFRKVIRDHPFNGTRITLEPATHLCRRMTIFINYTFPSFTPFVYLTNISFFVAEKSSA
jgi:hypothetical protein